MSKRRRKKSSGVVSWILIMICLIVFCGSGAKLLFYFWDKFQAEQEFAQIRESARDLSDVYAQNHDLIGWIKIEDTKIDYPVMQTPQDPEYYLHTDFNGEYSASGTPFLDAASVVMPRTFVDSHGETYELNVTWNWLIYGHNMKSGTMFAALQKYDSQEFWEGHKTFTFDVYHPDTGVTESGVYEIFAVSRSQIKASDSNAFQYYKYAGYTDEQKFYEFVSGVKAESSYETGITPQFGDQLVTLSTCAYHVDEGRMYIVGRRVQ